MPHHKAYKLIVIENAQVERERDGGVRPAAPVRNADEQGSVYKNFAGNPAESLSGIMGFH